jgi:hypothetical protein
VAELVRRRFGIDSRYGISEILIGPSFRLLDEFLESSEHDSGGKQYPRVSVSRNGQVSRGKTGTKIGGSQGNVRPRSIIARQFTVFSTGGLRIFHVQFISYFDFQYRTSTGSRELLDLRFFRSIHRGYIFAQLEMHFRRLPERHGLRNLRDDIHGFHIYDADETPATQSLLWGENNIHEEWGFGAAHDDGLPNSHIPDYHNYRMVAYICIAGSADGRLLSVDSDSYLLERVYQEVDDWWYWMGEESGI